jgi:hypothetical protein
VIRTETIEVLTDSPSTYARIPTRWRGHGQAEIILVKRNRPALILKLIVRHARRVVLNELSFRLRYLVGFLLFVLALWCVKVTVAWILDINYWDQLKSDQFKYLDELKKHDRR